MESPSRLAGILLALALAPTGALAGPAPTQAAYAPSVHRAVAVDTDGDGLDDSIDGCPSVAADNPTGCPTAGRDASLRWREGINRLTARITSPVVGCAAGARISLWRVSEGRDTKVTGAVTSSSGKAKFRAKRRAVYYLTVSPSYVTGVAECARASSSKVRIPVR